MTNQFPQYKKHLIPLINTKKKKIDYIELLGKKKKSPKFPIVPSTLPHTLNYVP